MAQRFGVRSALLIAALASALPARAESAQPARWVSADAVIYLEARRPAELLDRVAEPGFQKLLGTIPAYARYVKSDGYAKTRQVVDLIAGSLDATWDDGLRNLSGGGIVFAVEAAEGKAPAVYVLLTPRDPAFLTRANAKVLELARKDAEEKGRPDPVKSEEYRGITGHAPGEKGAYAIVQDVLVIADRPDSLKTLVDRVLDGGKAESSIVDDDGWKARRAEAKGDALAWSYVRFDRLRALDPKKLNVPEKTPLPVTLLFGSWVEVLRKGPWGAASLSWSGDGLGAELLLPTPPGGYAGAFKGYVPPGGAGAAALLKPPGVLASLSLWRDLSALWEARADLATPEEVQGLAKLDAFAGQFFGGRDFGSGVLGAMKDHWRLVVARQDYGAMTPSPDVKYPALALVVELDPEDDDFAQRLKVAFQSFVGLANLGAAQNKAPPLELGSETCEGVTIATTRFMPPKAEPSDAKEPVHYRHNFSPSAVQVGNHFIISSSVGLTRDLVKALKAPTPAATGPAEVMLEADGGVLAGLLELNRNRLVMQNMLEKGHDKARAEEEVGTLLAVLRYLEHGRLAVQENGKTVRLNLDFALGK